MSHTVQPVMRVPFMLAVIVVGFAACGLPAPAEATSCGGTISSAMAFDGADLVFVGTVARSDAPGFRRYVKADGLSPRPSGFR
jgi:hypothetical protein